MRIVVDIGEIRALLPAVDEALAEPMRSWRRDQAAADDFLEWLHDAATFAFPPAWVGTFDGADPEGHRLVTVTPGVMPGVMPESALEQRAMDGDR
jgi:hypothetical protein